MSIKTLVKNPKDVAIPELCDSEVFDKSGWLSPEGVFYGCDDYSHLTAAAFLCIFQLGMDETDLQKYKFFKENWDTKLLKLSWAEIKDISWIHQEHRPPSIICSRGLTQKQRDTLFDYDQQRGTHLSKDTANNDSL